MKISGIPIIYIVIAVGVLGIVTYSYVSYNKPAFIADDTLKCQRQYDFSQVQFTAEAKQDWDKCYMPQPLYERRQDGQVMCLDYPEFSCNRCAQTLALKYNNTNYCDIIRSCGNKSLEVEKEVNNCKNFINQIYFKDVCTITLLKYNVNLTLVVQKQLDIYPNLTAEIKRKCAAFGVYS